MFQQFFEDTLQTTFIKAVLNSSPVPVIRAVTEGDTIVEDCTYIYKTSVIKCTQTGTLNAEQQDITSTSTAKFVVIAPYNFMINEPKYTERYKSKYSYYDSDTHYHLGLYLRLLNACKGINLMHLYNCFNYKFVDNIELHPTTIYNRSSNLYKIVAVPIKFNLKYTVAIDCSLPVVMKAVLLNDLGLIREGDSTAAENMVEDSGSFVSYYSSLQFNCPVTYQITNTDAHRLKQEQYLTLLIQLPRNNSSSIVILEGDYTTKQTIVNAEYLNYISTPDINKALLNKSSLLNMNTGVSYAYDTLLVDYLLLSVITSDEEISENIYRVQSSIIDGDLYITYMYKDSTHSPQTKVIRFNYNVNNPKKVWSRELRYFLYKYYFNRAVVKADNINGFVDVNIEKLLMKEQQYVI